MASLPLRSAVLLERRIRAALPVSITLRLPRQIAFRTVGDAQSAILNRRYRGKNAPANVLSFLYGPEYGEVILCLALIRSEAGRQGRTMKAQMTWMMLHGMLHLAGIHHEESSAMAKRAEQLEWKMLQTLGTLK